MNEELINEVTEETAEEVVKETAEETATPKKERAKTPMVILDSAHFMEEVGKLIGEIPEGKTLEGFYNYFYSAMKAKYLESIKKRTDGYLCGSDKDVIEWVQKYFSPEVKEGELVPEPTFNNVAIKKPATPSQKPKKDPTPEEIAKKAAKEAEKKRKEEMKKKKEEMKKKWQQQSFDFFKKYGV